MPLGDENRLDPGNRQQERIPQEPRGLLSELKQITIMVVIVPTFIILGLKLLTITSEGPRHVAPPYAPQKILKIILFGYSIAYTYYILCQYVFTRLRVFNWNRHRRPHDEEEQILGSLTLRLITLFLAVLLFIFVLISVLLCIVEGEWEWSFEQKSCAAWPNFDKLIEVTFILGVALFVFCNDLYESSTMASLVSKFVLLSASLYKYLSIVILECIYIAEEVYHKYNGSTETFYLIPVHKDGPYFLPLHIEHDEKCEDGSFECLMEEYVEMFYVAISELLVIDICIILSKIYQTGELQTGEIHSLSRQRKILIGAFIILFVLIQLLLIYVYGYQKLTDGLAAKLLLTSIHLFTVTIGLLGCIYFWCKDDRIDRNIPEIREPLDILDKNLISVGMVGIVAYTIMGAIHSYNLITGNYSTLYGWLSFFVQTLFQTLIMLKCKMTGWKMNGILAFVNFMLFSLDLFDALTLGIYANPIAGDTNLDFLLIVRLLEPFNVFYRYQLIKREKQRNRFHSLSVLMENVERNSTEAASRRNTGPNAANGNDNGGFHAAQA